MMGNAVLVHLILFGIALCSKFENAKGRSLLVPSSAPSSLVRPVYHSPSLLYHSSISSASISPPTRPENSMETGPKHSPPMQMAKETHHINRGILLIIILVPVIVGFIMITSICTWLYRRTHGSVLQPPQPQRLLQTLDPERSACVDAYRSMPLGPLLNRLNSFRGSRRKGCAYIIEYSLLQAATNNFSTSDILGEGGFGCVYRARLDDDFFAAVKKLDEGSKQAEYEFQNEVELMSKIRHPNLVSLLGFCIHGKTRLLVYELMQNGSLEDQLHGPSHGSALTWYLRMKIALDSARGLEHLHEHCNPSVIHCDFKSSNILLDASFNAKLSDFGLAVTVGEAMGDKNVELLGTLGYVAPEYLLDGKLTEKSDVYGFGVVLLELIMGRKPVDKSVATESQSLVSWAMPQLTDREKLPTIVDPMIKGTMNLKHLYQRPIRRGVVGQFLMVEDLGLMKVNVGDLHVFRIYSRLDDTKKGEIACTTAGEVKSWMEAFEKAKQEGEKVLLMKSVGVVDASPDAVFEMVISLDKSQRYEWDMLTADLESVERINGHFDVVYGTYDPKYLTRTASPKQEKGTPRSVVTQMMEIHSTGWGPWRKRYYAKFEKTITYVLLCQVAGPDSNAELMLSVPATEIDTSQFKGTMNPAKSGNDSDCWSDPGGKGFMVRGKSYLKDYAKSDAGRRLPFILVINLQVPAKPNYSMVFYYGANRPIRKGSLLDKFANGGDMFRDARFKLIPSIVEGYWMIKRAVGTKACLLGRAVTCRYLRQDNFFEGKEEDELPEYLLGTVRINRAKIDSAISFWGHA